jgi:hypothetical protein
MSKQTWYIENIDHNTCKPLESNLSFAINQSNVNNEGVTIDDIKYKIDKFNGYIIQNNTSLEIKSEINSDVKMFRPELLFYDDLLINRKGPYHKSTTLGKTFDTKRGKLFKIKLLLLDTNRSFNFMKVDNIGDIKTALKEEFKSVDNKSHYFNIINSATFGNLPYIILKLFLTDISVYKEVNNSIRLYSIINESPGFFHFYYFLTASLKMIALDKSNNFTPNKNYYGVGCFNTSRIQRNDNTLNIYDFLTVTPSYEDALYALKSKDKANCIYKFFFPKDSASKYLVNLGKYNPYIGENITMIRNSSNFVIDKVLKKGDIYIINLFPYEYRTHYIGSYNRTYFCTSKSGRYSTVKFNDCDTLLNLKSFKFYKSIQNITIQNVEINDNQFKQILDIIKLNGRFLKELKICGCKISKQNIESLSKVLKNNKLLDVLTINNVYEFDHLIMKSINQSLSFNKLIKILDLGNNNLGPKGAQYAARMIKGYQFLDEISLMSNMIGDEGALAISQVLINSAENITKLNVADNNLSDIGLAYINNLIGVNASLEDLDLSHNLITDNGFISFVDVLSLNYKLTDIDLRNNNITIKGVEYQKLRLANDTLDRRIIVISDYEDGNFGDLY